MSTNETDLILREIQHNRSLLEMDLKTQHALLKIKLDQIDKTLKEIKRIQDQLSRYVQGTNV